MRSQKDDFAKETYPQVQTVYRVKQWILKQNFNNCNKKQTLSTSHCLSGGENVVGLNKKKKWYCGIYFILISHIQERKSCEVFYEKLLVVSFLLIPLLSIYDYLINNSIYVYYWLKTYLVLNFLFNGGKVLFCEYL